MFIEKTDIKFNYCDGILNIFNSINNEVYNKNGSYNINDAITIEKKTVDVSIDPEFGTLISILKMVVKNNKEIQSMLIYEYNNGMVNIDAFKSDLLPFLSDDNKTILKIIE